MKNTFLSYKKLFLTIFFILLSGFLFHYWLDGQAVYGDGIYYWMLTRSVGIDHDIKLNDEVAHRYFWQGNNTNIQQLPIQKNTKKLQLSAFHLPIGPSLFFLPWFFIGDGIAHVASFFNPNILPNGYSDTYQITTGIGVIIYAMIGLITMFQLLRKFYSLRVTWLVLFFVLFATDLYYYTSLDILNSHAISFMVSSIIIFSLYKFFNSPSYRLAFFIGLLYGAQVITRTQDALFGVCILTIFLFTWQKKKSLRSVKSVGFIILFILGTILTVSPQLAIWGTIYGGIFNIPYTRHPHVFDFLHPHLLGLLINPHTGILLYTPILLFCIYGLYYFIKINKALGTAAILTVIAEYYLIASWGAWNQAEAYGIRMLISCMPFFMLGLGALLTHFTRHKKIILSLGVTFIIWNLLAILAYQLFLKNPTFDGNHTTKQDHLQKIYHLFHQ